MKTRLLYHTFPVGWKHFKCFVQFLLFALCTPSFAQIQLVQDLNTTTHNASGEFGETKEVNGIVYVAANHGLWKTDGTQEGSVLLKQFQYISSLVAFRNQLFFIAETTVHGRELWKSNGTVEGTVLVKDIEPGRGGSTPESLVVANNYLFLITTTTAYGKEVWRSNGSTGGTYLLRDIIKGKISSNPSSLVAFQNRLFFAASDGLVGQELWSSDGSTAGTNLFADIRTGKPGSGPGNLTVSGSLLFFQALDDTHGRELWRTDGTQAGTFMPRDIRPGTANSTPASLVNVNGTLYFVAKEGYTEEYGERSENIQFWRSDGTPAGTTRAFATEFILSGWTPLRDVASAYGKLYFYVGDHVYEFDGTTDDPVVVAEIGDFYNDNITFRVLDNKLYVINQSAEWVGEDYEYQTDIYKYEGGMGLIRRFPGNFTIHLSKTTLGLLFGGPTDDERFMLWKSDGTYAGSTPFMDVTDFTEGSGPRSLVELHGNVLFVARDTAGGQRNLYKMDGTTTVIEKISNVEPQNLTTSGSYAYFVYLDGLWKTNGTTIGTTIVKQFNNGTPTNLTDVNGTLFFSAPDQNNTLELWKSNGTFASTVRVKDVYPGSQGSTPTNLVNLNGTLFFVAYHPTFGRSVWKSDGTDAGTAVLLPGNPDHAFTNPRDLVATQSLVFFIARGNTAGIELYRTDGTSGGTVRVKDIRTGDFEGAGASEDVDDLWADGNKLYFRAIPPGDSRRSLWVSDGTEAGTSLVMPISAFEIFYLRSVNGRMHVAVPDASGERLDLFSTDGTAEGTSLIKKTDISGVRFSVVMDNVLYFGGPGYFAGTSDLWRTDGTACGTFVVPSDLGYGVRLHISPLSVVVNKNRRLVFPGYSMNVGDELFKLEKSLAPKSPCGTPVSATAEVVAEVLSGSLSKDITSAPNPFADRFTLRVDSPEDKSYNATILTVNGKEVSSLNELQTNRDYEVGSDLRSGMYLVKIKIDNRTEVRRMIKTQ
jgi:ELWxxDGT repeat protein